MLLGHARHASQQLGPVGRRDGLLVHRRDRGLAREGLLGGSWVVISGVISKVTIVITHIRELITILITTHEPPSRV